MHSAVLVLLMNRVFVIVFVIGLSSLESVALVFDQQHWVSSGMFDQSMADHLVIFEQMDRTTRCTDDWELRSLILLPNDNRMTTTFMNVRDVTIIDGVCG